MDKFIELVSSNQALVWSTTVALVIATLMLVVLFFQYNIDRARGRHAKFLWFEVNAVQPYHPPPAPQPHQPIINGKNVNTGINHGEIGDKYTGLKQRQVTPEDLEYLQREISRFSTEHFDSLVRSHITLGYPGCKETTALANQLVPMLKNLGFHKIEPMNLQTFGMAGAKFGVSEAPDNSLMVEIYPADNVE